jgi:pilus assembly protein Flp/PilA
LTRAGLIAGVTQPIRNFPSRHLFANRFGTGMMPGRDETSLTIMADRVDATPPSMAKLTSMQRVPSSVACGPVQPGTTAERIALQRASRASRSQRMKTLVKFLKDESGATAIEYGLIAAGISVAIVAVLKGVGSDLKGSFVSMQNGLK